MALNAHYWFHSLYAAFGCKKMFNSSTLKLNGSWTWECPPNSVSSLLHYEDHQKASFWTWCFGFMLLYWALIYTFCAYKVHHFRSPANKTQDTLQNEGGAKTDFLLSKESTKNHSSLLQEKGKDKTKLVEMETEAINLDQCPTSFVYPHRQFKYALASRMMGFAHAIHVLPLCVVVIFIGFHPWFKNESNLSLVDSSYSLHQSHGHHFTSLQLATNVTEMELNNNVSIDTTKLPFLVDNKSGRLDAHSSYRKPRMGVTAPTVVHDNFTSHTPIHTNVCFPGSNRSKGQCLLLSTNMSISLPCFDSVKVSNRQKRQKNSSFVPRFDHRFESEDDPSAYGTHNVTPLQSSLLSDHFINSKHSKNKLFHNDKVCRLEDEPFYLNPVGILEHYVILLSFAYFLVDLMHFIWFESKDVLLIIHHLFAITIACIVLYLQAGGLAYSVGLFVGEITNPIQSAWYIAKVVQNDYLYHKISPAFTWSFLLTRVLILPLCIYPVACEIYSTVAVSIPGFVRVIWLFIIGGFVLGSWLWSCLLYRGYRKKFGFKK